MFNSITNGKRILILAPHTDDAELGCGGSISRLRSEDTDVFVVSFSYPHEKHLDSTNEHILRDEFFQSMAVLGIPTTHCWVLDYKIRELSYNRQEILEELINIRRKIEPNVVFLPSGNDLHQDHQVIHIEGLRAFKDLTIWGYELPWNHITFSAQAFISLEEKHILHKWKALSQYKSQLELDRYYFNYKFFESLATIRGTQVRSPYAEAFEVVRVKI
jgi:LmbE family N-acetylglucosaminyl deacetylase